MRNVLFKRTRSKGLVANLWIYDGASGDLLFQLSFVNDRAKAQLQENTNYLLHWVLNGSPGDELKVDRRIEGVDDDFVALLGSSKIPDDDHATQTGTRLTFVNDLQFTLP